MRILFRLFGSVAALLILFLAVGLVLPGTWTASSSLDLPAPPERVFPFLEDLALWDDWTPWGGVESAFEGVTAGVGARRSWEHAQLGSGAVTITESDYGRLVRYRVVVGDGQLSVDGTFTVESTASGSRVTWLEEGDFGWNPLMGYAARRMPEAQGTQLRQGLEKLRRLVEEP